VTDSLREALFGTGPETDVEHAALIMASNHADLINSLRDARIAAGLTRTELGQRMAWPKKQVTEFESYWYDAKLSEIRRYAIAVGVMVTTIVAEFEQLPGEASPLPASHTHIA
jgi:ribosome-binding protein aMBF1 (putative translation factor)